MLLPLRRSAAVMGPAESEDDHMDPDEFLRDCAEHLIHAIHNRDAKALADALKDAFAIIEATEDDDDEPEGGPPVIR